MKSKGKCVVSTHVSAPCDRCGRRADPSHILEEGEGENGSWSLYCAECCPEHGVPLFAAAKGVL